MVYDGDTADSLATEFCLNNGLNIEMQNKLKMLLEQQIAGVLPKIVEDESSEASEPSKEEPRELPPKAKSPIEDVETEPLADSETEDQEINEHIYN